MSSPKEPERLPRYLTTGQLAEYLGVAAETVRHWRKNHQGPRGKKFSGSVRYPREEVWAYEEDPQGYDARQALKVDI
jgi:predicted DNA-binding transcriptional regulator AlpA